MKKKYIIYLILMLILNISCNSNKSSNKIIDSITNKQVLDTVKNDDFKELDKKFDEISKKEKNK